MAKDWKEAVNKAVEIEAEAKANQEQNLKEAAILKEPEVANTATPDVVVSRGAPTKPATDGPLLEMGDDGKFVFKSAFLAKQKTTNGFKQASAPIPKAIYNSLAAICAEEDISMIVCMNLLFANVVEQGKMPSIIKRYKAQVKN